MLMLQDNSKMENNNSLVAEVKEKANLTNSEELSLEESKKILNLIEEGEIDEKHIKALAKDSPGFSAKFIESITELVHAFPMLVENKFHSSIFHFRM